MDVDKAVSRVVRTIRDKYQPDKIILFGSRVWGEPDGDSDLDVLVVKRSRKSEGDRVDEVSELLRPRLLPVDIFVKTPKEIHHRLEMGDFFIRRIIQQGAAVYERPQSRPTMKTLRQHAESVGRRARPMSDELLEEWISKAEEDYRVARVLEAADVPAAICFHSHQCIEKYLKSVLVARSEEPPRTHDLFELKTAVTTGDPSFPAVMEGLRTLNPYSGATRYPGLNVTASQAVKARAIMEALRAQIRQFLAVKG